MCVCVPQNSKCLGSKPHNCAVVYTQIGLQCADVLKIHFPCQNPVHGSLSVCALLRLFLYFLFIWVAFRDTSCTYTNWLSKFVFGIVCLTSCFSRLHTHTHGFMAQHASTHACALQFWHCVYRCWPYPLHVEHEHAKILVPYIDNVRIIKHHKKVCAFAHGWVCVDYSPPPFFLLLYVWNGDWLVSMHRMLSCWVLLFCFGCVFDVFTGEYLLYEPRTVCKYVVGAADEHVHWEDIWQKPVSLVFLSTILLPTSGLLSSTVTK